MRGTKSLFIISILTSVLLTPFNTVLATVIEPGTKHIDFNGLELMEGDPVPTLLGHEEVSFSNLIYIVPGEPLGAFVNANGSESGNTVDDADTGNTIALPNISTTGSIMFSVPVKNLALHAIDVEVSVGITEIIQFNVFDSFNNLLSTAFVFGDQPGAGQGSVVEVDFLGITNISRLDIIRAEGPLHSGVAGFALDDLYYMPVPIPPALVLFASALIGFAGISRLNS